MRNFTAGDPQVVTFHNGAESDTQNIYGGSGTLKANSFTVSGKIFAGWATSENGEVIYADGAEITLAAGTAGMDLYAVWADAYTVTFEDQGAVSTVEAAQNYAIGGKKIPTPAARTGYTFSGWFSGESQLTAETVISAPITYTAKWTPITYTVCFNANGGEGTMEDITAGYDEEIVLTENSFTREGYTFIGWATYAASYASAVKYQDQAAVTNLKSKQDETVTLYAVWAGLPVNVTIDLNYETEGRISRRTGVVGQNYNYIYNEKTGGADFSKLPDPSRSGYNFKGWYNKAQGGDLIGTETAKYGFTAEDARKGKTLYASWSEAVTITFDAGGGSCYTKAKSIDKGTSYGTLPSASWSGKSFEGWYTSAEGGEKVENTTVFYENTTLYARYRNYQITITFQANGGEGTMEKFVCASGVPTKLPKNQFTREGYRFTKWCTSGTESSWSTTYPDEGEYKKTTSYGDTTATLYALWEETVFGKAYNAIQAALPADSIIRKTGALNLPVSGAGYTITYTSGDPAYLSEDGSVTALPASGAVKVSLTAAVTDSSSLETECKTYVLTLYSPQSSAAEAELQAAADALTGNFKPTYGTDANAAIAVKRLLAEKGYSGISVSVKEAVSDSSGYSSIEADGTIHYYFRPNMTGSGSYFYTTFIFEKHGASTEKEWYTNIGWDLNRAREVLEQAADRVLVPTVPVSELTLLRYPLKEGVSLDDANYSYSSDFETWATVTWKSSDSEIAAIGSAPSYPYYAPYSTTLNNATPLDQTVLLTATIKCNNLGLSTTRELQVTVQHGVTTQSVQDALREKLESGLSSPGLTDYVTGAALDPANVTNDIQFPTTRDFKIDGKYYPVTITSSNPEIIETPSVQNAARAWVFRPLPGSAPEDVTLTIRITEKSSGIYAEKQIPVTVQPLTQAEIDAEIRLMELVKMHYFDGIKNGNTRPDQITADLRSFQEVWLDAGGSLVWVYDRKDRANHGIVPVAMDGWETTEQWRTFRSGNDAVITHENLLVTRQKEHKAVTVTSYLSSETLGKYAEKYPDNADFQKLYYQPVTANLIVAGTAPTAPAPVEEKVSVSFALRGDGTWAKATVQDLPEGTTVFDVFTQVLRDNHCCYTAQGSYITSITGPGGTTLREREQGALSGWMYSVNGRNPGTYMSGYTLKSGDDILVYFHSGDILPSRPSGDASEAEAVVTKKEDGTYAVSVSADGEAAGVTAVLPDAAAGQIVVSVAPDGTETILPKTLVRDGKAYVRLTGSAVLKLVSSEPVFRDVAESAWYGEAVSFAASRQLLQGTGGQRFSPTAPATRGMVAAVLHRLECAPASGSASFSDVLPGSWYTGAVSWAARNRIVEGYPGGAFVPDRAVSRQELAVILYRYAVFAGLDTTVHGTLDAYSDAEQAAGYAETALIWAVEHGLIQGRGNGILAPGDPASRCETAAILQRLVTLLVG